MTDEAAPLTGAVGDPALAEALAGMVRRSRRVLWMVVFTQGLVLALAIIGIVVLAAALAKADHRIASDEVQITSGLCDAQFTIGTAQLPAPASKLGVQFVEANRKAFTVLGCPGQLGPPSPGLVKLGRKYGVPIRY